MMISPESYFEGYLKDKTPEQIMTTIRSLKRGISCLKKQIVDSENVSHPSIELEVGVLKACLERAKQALVDAGGTYIPTKNDLKEAEFNARIPLLRRITFNKSSFCNGSDDISVVIVDNDGCYLGFSDWSGDVLSKYDCTPIYKEEFQEKLKLLDLWEWKKRYINYDILDGVQWELLLDFDDEGKPIKIYGSNKYPDNFYELEELFNADAYCEYDEE